MVKEKIDIDSILKTVRSSFGKNEKALSNQLITGDKAFKELKDTDFIKYPGEHWKELTGIPGLQFGKIIQIAGRPDSGKSSHASAFMKVAQDDDHIVVLWDTEDKFSPTRFDKYFKGCSSELIVNKSKIITDGGDLIIKVIESILDKYSSKKVLLVWDSVGGSMTTAEDEKDLRQGQQMAAAAKDNGKVVRALVSLNEQFRNKDTGEERLSTLLINQVYANIGAPGQKESGGQKIEFHSSLIIQLTRKGDLIKTKDKVKRRVGIVSRAKVRKNHLFDGEDCVAELDLEVTAGGIKMAKGLKEKEDGFEDDDGEEE